MDDKEYLEYMKEHYIKNDEHRLKICKDLGITENQMYKRNKILGIHRPKKLFQKDKKDSKTIYKFDLLYNKWTKVK